MRSFSVRDRGGGKEQSESCTEVRISELCPELERRLSKNLAQEFL